MTPIRELALAARALCEETSCLRLSEEISLAEGCPCPKCTLERLIENLGPWLEENRRGST